MERKPTILLVGCQKTIMVSIDNKEVEQLFNFYYWGVKINYNGKMEAGLNKTTKIYQSI